MKIALCLKLVPSTTADLRPSADGKSLQLGGVEMLVNPTGAKHTLEIWDQQANQFLVALILHVLYTEPDHRKNLAVVRERLLDFRKTCESMSTISHRLHPVTGKPQVHPEIRLVARELLAQPDKFQASVRGTAAAYLTLYVGLKP